MEKLDFIQQFRAFIKVSAGRLDAKEQAMYVRLLGIWNELRRPEWFDVSTSQLMSELGIKKKNVVIRMKENLVKKGFILTKNTSRTATTRFKIIKLETSNQQLQDESQLVTTGYNASNQSLQALVTNGYKTSNQKLQALVTNGYKTSNQKLQALVTNGYTSQRYKDTENIKEAAAAAAAPDLSEVLTLFSNNIHPVTGEIELGKLISFLDDYGEEWTLAAITEAAENNGRSVRYIEAILERWQRDGFKTGGKPYGRAYGGAKGVRSRAEAKPEPNYGFMEAVKNRPHPWDLPQEGSEGAGDT